MLTDHLGDEDVPFLLHGLGFIVDEFRLDIGQPSHITELLVGRRLDILSDPIQRFLRPCMRQCHDILVRIHLGLGRDFDGFLDQYLLHRLLRHLFHLFRGFFHCHSGYSYGLYPQPTTLDWKTQKYPLLKPRITNEDYY